MCQAVTFNLSHRTATAGPGFSSYFCFDWGLIVTRLKLGVHSKRQRCRSTAVHNGDHMLRISIGWGVDGGYASMGAGAIVPTDLSTLNHMSNLILVSRLNWCHVSHRPICHTGWRGNHVERLGGGGKLVCAGKVCVVAQLRERGKLRRYRLTRGKERVGGVMGWG